MTLTSPKTTRNDPTVETAQTLTRLMKKANKRGRWLDGVEIQGIEKKSHDTADVFYEVPDGSPMRG